MSSSKDKELILEESGEIEIDGVLHKLFILPMPQDTVDQMIKNGESSEEVFDSFFTKIIKKILRCAIYLKSLKFVTKRLEIIGGIMSKYNVGDVVDVFEHEYIIVRKTDSAIFLYSKVGGIKKTYFYSEFNKMVNDGRIKKSKAKLS